MIIIIFPNELNVQNARILSKTNFLGGEDEDEKMQIGVFPQILPASDDEDIILFDMSADGKFQQPTSPGWLIDKLKEKGILNKAKNIYLLMSDVNKENPLNCYAQQIADYINDKYNTVISVHVPSKIGNPSTVVVPPSKTDGESWEIYSLDNLPTKPFDLDTVFSIESKKIDWKGKDVKSFMNDPQRTIKPSSIDPFTNLPKAKI